MSRACPPLAGFVSSAARGSAKRILENPTGTLVQRRNLLNQTERLGSLALAERDHLQSGQPVVTASVAEEDWELVADQPAAKVGEAGRTAVETRAVLLVVAGRRASESEGVRQQAENDRDVASAGRLTN